MLATRLCVSVSSLACLVLALAAAPAAAQDKKLSIELNNATDVNGGCRLTYIATNGTGTPLEKTSYEIVVFDATQKVSQFLILEFGRLPAGKTKVVQFDFANHACNTITRILVNDVSECVAGGETVPVCLDDLQTNTRTSIGFGQ